MGYLETYLIVTIIAVIIAFLLFITGMCIVFDKNQKKLKHTLYCRNKEITELNSMIIERDEVIRMQQTSIDTLSQRLHFLESGEIH